MNILNPPSLHFGMVSISLETDWEQCQTWDMGTYLIALKSGMEGLQIEKYTYFRTPGAGRSTQARASAPFAKAIIAVTD